MTEWNEFRPQTRLLNPKFDGYRLSLDPLAQYILKFSETLQVQKEFQLDSNFYTLNSIKAFRSINQLYFNPWKDDQDFYFFDHNHALQKITILPTDSLLNLKPPTCIYQLNTNSIQGSLIFVSETLVILCDGRSKLLIISTSESKWKLLYEQDIHDFVTSPIRLLHAIYYQDSIHALVGYINEECHLLWVTITDKATGQWTLARQRLLKGKCWPDFVAIESSGNSLYIVVEGGYTFTSDSLIEVKADVPEKQPTLEEIESSLKYIWSQTHDSVDIEIQSPALADQSYQWSVKIDATHLTCSLNDVLLIDATLFDTVNVKESSHVVVSDRKHELLINLQKSKYGYFWNEIFLGGRSISGNIKMIDTGESKQMDTDEDVKQPYNSQQLEECDQYPNENDSFLYRIDGDTHKTTHQGLITNQILFTQAHESSLCIRHDVDGLIWKVDEITENNREPWHHHATLNAFGYVQASKQNRKFICAPNDNSYVAIIDAHAHVYIYKQETPASTISGSSLRNRKTGQVVDTISKQYMVSLENHNEILGAIASKERLYVLLADQFVVIAV